VCVCVCVCVCARARTCRLFHRQKFPATQIEALALEQNGQRSQGRRNWYDVAVWLAFSVQARIHVTFKCIKFLKIVT